jgi:EAL domain-containing protein (putative c-di-GMP-specific phosphodiesterase class I)
MHDKDELVLYQQPILALETGRVERTELLVRRASPGAFEPFAQRLGRDRWVIARGIELLAARQTDGLHIGIEVGLSRESVGDAGVVDFIADEVTAASVDPGLLTFVLSEAPAWGFAARLAELGCRLALDDVGSCPQLEELPFDLVKLGGDILADPVRVQTIVGIAGAMGRLTAAKSVDDVGTLERLRGSGVDYAQGGAIGRPGPAVMVPKV